MVDEGFAIEAKEMICRAGERNVPLDVQRAAGLHLGVPEAHLARVEEDLGVADSGRDAQRRGVTGWQRQAEHLPAGHELAHRRRAGELVGRAGAQEDPSQAIDRRERHAGGIDRRARSSGGAVLREGLLRDGHRGDRDGAEAWGGQAQTTIMAVGSRGGERRDGASSERRPASSICASRGAR